MWCMSHTQLEIKSETSGNFERALVAFIRDPVEYPADLSQAYFIFFNAATDLMRGYSMMQLKG